MSDFTMVLASDVEFVMKGSSVNFLSFQNVSLDTELI